MGNVWTSQPNPKKAQSSGLSPSSTEESANKVVKEDVVSNEERKLSASNPDEKPEEPQSNDTSYGVEATAVRTLAATTGTVAILGTTAQSMLKEDETAETPKEELIENVDLGDQNMETEVINKEEETAEVMNEDVKDSAKSDQNENEEKKESGDEEKDKVDNKTDDVPITELVSDLPITVEKETEETVSPIDTNSLKQSDSGIIDEILPETQQEETSIASIEIGVILPSPDDTSKTNEDEDNDISSEQLKTNSLSDVSETLHSETDEAHQKPETEAEEQMVVKAFEEIIDEAAKNQVDLEMAADVESDTVGKTSPDLSAETDVNAAATKIQSGIRGFLTRKQLLEEGSPRRLSESIIDDLKQEVDEICDEAERATESIINSPISDAINPDDEFPAPPDDMLLEVKQEKDKQNVEPPEVPSETLDSSSKLEVSNNNNGVINDKLPEFDDNSVADSEPLPNDDDLPAPDFDLLESSNTDDIKTEIINESENVNNQAAIEDQRDSTEGDMTMDEDSYKIKELQKPQECDEIINIAYGEAEENAAAKIQAKVREFLSKKQDDSSEKTDSDDASGFNNSRTDLIYNAQTTDDSSTNNVADNNVWETLEKEMADAATTIQAGFRGYMARKKSEAGVETTKEEDSPKSENQNLLEPAAGIETTKEEDSPKSDNQLVEIAKEVDCSKSENQNLSEPAAGVEIAKEEDTPKLDVNQKSVDSDLINKSATKIQAGVRGFLVRKKKQVDTAN